LFDTDGDGALLTVFDYAPEHVAASHVPGDDTVVAEVPVASLTAGTYERARVVLSHLTFDVDATVHVAGFAAAGEVSALQVLSDGTTLDDAVHDRGYWRYVFHYAGMDFPVGGEDGAPVAEPPPGGPFEVIVAEGETGIEFPVSILIDLGIEQDVDVVLVVNIHEAFRWEDQPDEGYTEGVFDATPPQFEPIRGAGANTYTLGYE
jgi:hypothetical protein